MSDKQYLEAVTQFLDSHLVYVDESSYEETDNYWYLSVETNRRLSALKAQEDNIKSDMWREKNPMVFDTSIMKSRERTPADDEYAKDVMKEFGL